MASKLFSVISTFSPREWKAFETFLEGRNFKRKAEVLDLFWFLKDRCLAAVVVEPSKEEIASTLFLGDKIQEVRYLESDLVKWIESWWVHKELQQDTVLKQTILLRALQKRSLQKPFRQILDSAFDALEKTPYRDMDYLLKRYQLNNLAFEFATLQENRGIDPGLPAMLADLEVLYRTGSLKYGSILVNLGNVVSAQVDPEMIERLRHIGDWRGLCESGEVGDLREFQKEGGRRESNEGNDAVGIEIYHAVLLTLIDPGEEGHYQKLLDLLESSSRFFGEDEIGQLYAFALNYCIKKLNEGKGEYLQQLFVLYQRLLDKEVIFSGPFILQQHFKNIVTTALRLGEFAWTERFLRGYTPRVSPEARENASTYNFAALYFATGAYSKAMRLLQEVEFTDVYYHVDSKALLLKTYYELEEWEPLLSLVDAFGNYLRRNRMISEYQRKVYWNFLKFAKKLVRKHLGSRKPVEEIVREMEEVQEIADLRWLRLKAGELI